MNNTPTPLTQQQINGQILDALYMLQSALVNRDTEDAHNILCDGGCDLDEDKMEQDLENYLTHLNNLISLF